MRGNVKILSHLLQFIFLYNRSYPSLCILSGEIGRHKKIGRKLVFSADLCYNGDNEKASPFGRGGGEADGEG